MVIINQAAFSIAPVFYITKVIAEGRSWLRWRGLLTRLIHRAVRYIVPLRPESAWIDTLTIRLRRRYRNYFRSSRACALQPGGSSYVCSFLLGL